MKVVHAEPILIEPSTAVGYWLDKRRLALGMSLTDLGYRAGCCRSTARKVCSADCGSVRLLIVEAVVAALGCFWTLRRRNFRQCAASLLLPQVPVSARAASGKHLRFGYSDCGAQNSAQAATTAPMYMIRRPLGRTLTGADGRTGPWIGPPQSLVRTRAVRLYEACAYLSGFTHGHNELTHGL